MSSIHGLVKTKHLPRKRSKFYYSIPFLLLLSLCPNNSFGWGAVGHQIVAEYGTSLVSKDVLKNCNVSVEEILAHTNDPDKIWKGKRKEYPKEAQAHYFHVDNQPSNWRKLSSPKNIKDGYLVYRINHWIKEAKSLRSAKKWPELKTHLYGLSHYIGDLSQPLHLHHDYDGENAGLPDLHSQFETKMLNRFENNIRTEVKKLLNSEKASALWSSIDTQELVFNVATQTNAKADSLFALSKPALKTVSSRKGKRTSRRFLKPVLYQQTGQLASEQLALSARLWAHVLKQICSF